MTWLLRLYPCEWRRRYGAEMEEIVASQPLSLQLAVDLLGGAIDARFKPQMFARRLEGQAIENRGGTKDMLNRLRSCDPVATITPGQGGLAAGWALLVGVVMAGIMMLDPPRMTETIMLTMFPAVMVAPMQWLYLRGHSWLAKGLLFAGPLVICFLIGLFAAIAVAD